MAKKQSRLVFQRRARLFKAMRQAITGILYTTSRPITLGPLNDLVNSFSRFAGNQQTAFDNGAGRSAASVNGNMLELQVERAITQVLGRGLGRGNTSNFMTALTAAFPIASDGQVSNTPQRGVISLYNPNGGSLNGNYASGLNPYSNSSLGSLVGQLSAGQAALYHETSIVASDALKVLAGLEPFLPEADKEEVESLRSLIHSEIDAVVDEVARVDEPRVARMDDYLNALGLNLIEFGNRGLFDDRTRATIIGDETQTTGFELLKNYVTILRNIWVVYKNQQTQTQAQTLPPSLSEQVERANIVLPILAQGNVDFEAALDSVAFTESEQRSRAARFPELDGTITRLVPIGTVGGIRIPPSSSALFNLIFNLGLKLPDISVRDLADWINRFSNIEAPAILADSGQFGLDFVLDEADTLFWTIVPIIGILELLDSINATNRSTLRQILSNERVRWALDNLLEQLKVLADLA